MARFVETPIERHGWHLWFAWHPVFIPSQGWVWLHLVEREWSSKWWKTGQTWVVTYRIPAAKEPQP